MQGLRGKADGRIGHSLGERGAVACDKGRADQRRQRDLFVGLRGVPYLDVDGVELLCPLFVHGNADGHHALAGTVAHDHSQVGLGQRHDGRGVRSRLHVQLATGKRPGTGHGLAEVVKQVFRCCAKAGDDARAVELLRVSAASDHKRGQRVARVGRGGDAGIFVCSHRGLAEGGVLVHMAHVQGGVVRPSGGGIEGRGGGAAVSFFICAKRQLRAPDVGAATSATHVRGHVAADAGAPHWRRERNRYTRPGAGIDVGIEAGAGHNVGRARVAVNPVPGQCCGGALGIKREGVLRAGRYRNSLE